MNKSLVIVTAENSIRKKVRNTLNDSYYNISTTYLSDFKKLEKKLNDNIDLVIIDNNLKNKIKSYKMIRKISQEEDIPFIFLISEKEDNFFENKEFYPLSIFLSKPFSKAELKNNIEMIFYKYEFIKQTTKINEEQEMLLNNIQNQVWFLNNPDIYGRVNESHAEFLGFDKNNLSRWVKKGYLIKLRNGYYTFREYMATQNINLYLANRIYRPSYISLHTALAFYGLIPESVTQTTSVSTLKTALFRNTIGVFSYKKIKKEVKTLKEITDLPVAVGFGLKTRDDLKKVYECADGSIIGSKFINTIKKDNYKLKKVKNEIKNLTIDFK